MTDKTAFPGVPLDLPLPPELCETFGYRGDARYVAFSWSPCGDELVYDDARSSGTGASWAFQAYRRHRAVEPLLRLWNLGASDSAAEYALVIDRARNRASVAPLQEARAFLEDQWPPELPLTEEQVEEFRRQVDAMLANDRQDTKVDAERLQQEMQGQRARIGRMISFLDMCPLPEQGRGAG